jgi:hypothetical protein
MNVVRILIGVVDLYGDANQTRYKQLPRPQSNCPRNLICRPALLLNGFSSLVFCF